MKTVTIKLSIGADNCIRNIKVKESLSTKEAIKSFAKRKYTSIINMGGNIAVL